MSITFEPNDINGTEISRCLRFKNWNKVQKFFLRGEVSDTTINICKIAIRDFLANSTGYVDDFWKLPISCSSMYEDRRNNKKYWIDRAKNKWFLDSIPQPPRMP